MSMKEWEKDRILQESARIAAKIAKTDAEIAADRAEYERYLAEARAREKELYQR